MRLARSQDRGVALLVVVGVLAVLSLLIATFAMLMSVESTAVRNQTEHEMARQAAQAGLEHVVQSLRVAPNALAAGDYTAFCPDPTCPFFCKELARREGVKSGYLIHTPNDVTIHPGLNACVWAGGLGAVSAGLFDLNGMGYAADSDCTMHSGVRFTSHEASLYRVIRACFDDVRNNLPTATTDIDTYVSNFTTDSAVRDRIARVITQAVISGRYGADGLPGARGTEDHHAEHQADWTRWTPYKWRNGTDPGVAVSGELWTQAVAWDPATRKITIDTAAIGWPNGAPWANNRWAGYYVYVATGNKKGAWALVNSSTVNATLPTPRYHDLFLTNAPTDLAVAPAFALFDAFCLVPDNAAGLSRLGSSDLAPTALLWPNGILAGESWVSSLAYNEGTVALPVPATPSTALTTSYAFVNGALNEAVSGFYVVRILDGQARGQVRRILSNTGATLTLADAWTVQPAFGSRYRIQYDAYNYATFTAAVSNATVNTLRATGSPWTGYPAYWPGCAANIYAAGAGVLGQTRLIEEHSNDTLTLTRNWDTTPVNGNSFRIDLAQDAKYRPDNLQGDDSSYNSVAEVLSVMVSALEDYGLASGDAAFAAAALFSAGYDSATPKLRDCLTVAGALGPMKRSYASIGDWANDGIDNNGDGRVDDTAEADDYLNRTPAYLAQLYRQIGLFEWAHDPAGAPATRVPQAAQLLANILDSRDEDDLPVTLTQADLNETAVTFTVRGYEGVHFTEIMGTPPVIGPDASFFLSGVDTGRELVNDGKLPNPPGDTVDAFDNINAPVPPSYVELKDSQAWDWDNLTGRGWKLAENAPAGQEFLGTWQFNLALKNYGFKVGWYAIRIGGTPNTTFTFKTITPAQSGTVVTGAADASGIGWGYARLNGSNKLMAVSVTSGATNVLEFQLGHSVMGTRFDAFQLLPQFVEITNCAAHDVVLDLRTFKVNGVAPITNAPYAKIDGVTVRNAVGVGIYPPKYGTYVIALSEEAYARQFGAGAVKNGAWGDVQGEDYPVLFMGDLWTNAPAADTVAAANLRATAFLLGPVPANPLPTLSIAALANPAADIASTGPANAIDGDPNAAVITTDFAPGAVLPYISREKAVSLFSTAWRNWSGATDPATVTDLSASQNVSYGAALTARTNLNRAYDAVWNVYPATGVGAALFTTPGTFADRNNANYLTAANYNRVYPIILNRPYPSPGWLGLVPGVLRVDAVNPSASKGAWRTLDPNPDPATLPAEPEHLLGLLVSRSLVGGVHARINLNAPIDATNAATRRNSVLYRALTSVLDSASAGNLIDYRCATVNRMWDGPYTGPVPWYHRAAGWDHLMTDSGTRGLSDRAGIEDSGAGLIQDGAVDDADEKEEFIRRYANVIDLRTSNLKYVIAGLVYENGANAAPPDAPIAQARIEVEIDMSGPAKVVQFRYLTE